MHVFGESHGKMIGVVVEGVPPGMRIDTGLIQVELDKRRPGTNRHTSPRREEDVLKVLSGTLDGKSTGAPIAMAIENKDVISNDYSDFRERPRPGHADLPATVRYGGYHDIRGSGVFSGRMTAAFVMAGALARQILDARDIKVSARLVQIGKANASMTSGAEGGAAITREMESEIDKAMGSGDSVGARIECVVYNMPIGVGEPMFDSIESVIAHAMYSIPAVKAVSFGAGFDLAGMRGTDANDEYRFENGRIVTMTNNNGGVLGGMSNGMPVVFHVAVKPTPSISTSQRTVDLEKMTNCDIEIKGRHDPCIGLRALPVVENMAAFCIADLIMRCEDGKDKGIEKKNR